MLQLLRTWTQGAHVHLLRAVPVTADWARAVIKAWFAFFQSILGRVDDHHINKRFIPIKAGGWGLGPAVIRAVPAFIGVWEAGLQRVAEQMGMATLLEWGSTGQRGLSA